MGVGNQTWVIGKRSMCSYFLFLIKIDIIILLVNNLFYLICMDVLPIRAWCPGVQEKVLESLELEFQMVVTSRAAGRN